MAFFRYYIISIFIVVHFLHHSGLAMKIQQQGYEDRDLPNLGNTCFFNATLNLLFNSGFREKISIPQSRHHSETVESFAHRTRIKEQLVELFENFRGPLNRKDKLIRKVISEWNLFFLFEKEQIPAAPFLSFDLDPSRAQDMAESLRQLLNILDFPQTSYFEILRPVGRDLLPVIHEASKPYLHLYLQETSAKSIPLQEAINAHYGKDVEVLEDVGSWREVAFTDFAALKSRYLNVNTKEAYFVVEDRIFSKGSNIEEKSFAKLTFDLERPIVSIPVFNPDTQELSQKYMRVSSVGVHEGNTLGGHYYSMSVEQDILGNYFWVTYDDTRVFLGADSYKSATGSRVFHLVELDDTWGSSLDLKINTGVPFFNDPGKEYVILSADSGLSLNVEGDPAANDANVGLYEYSFNDRQIWSIVTLPDGNNCITLKKTGLALNVQGPANQAGNGTNVNAYKFYPNDEGLLWEIVPSFIEGGFFIRSVASKKTLNVEGVNAVNGRNVNIYSQYRDKGQIWYIVEKSKLLNFEDSDKEFFIVSLESLSNLKIVGDLNKNSAKVGINNADIQPVSEKWRIERHSNGKFLIISGNGKVLNVAGKTGTHKAGSVVNAYTYYEGDVGQLWEILPSHIKGGGYMIRSAASKLVLNLNNTGLGTGALNITPYLGTANQIWLIQEN